MSASCQQFNSIPCFDEKKSSRHPVQMMSSEATHRMSIAVSSVLIAGGLVAAVSGRPSVHEPETHTEK